MNFLLGFIQYTNSSDSTNISEKISLEAKYHEMYEEMRRHRDQEIIQANWCTIIQIAIISGLFIVLNQTNQNGIELNIGCINFLLLKIFMVLIILLLTVSSIFMVSYSHDRYAQLREFVNSLEPKNFEFKPDKKIITPKFFIIIIQITFCGFSLFLISLL